VDKESAMAEPIRTTQPSIPSGSVNKREASLSQVGNWREGVPITGTWITGMETTIQQTRMAYGWLVIGQAVGTGLACPTAHKLYIRCLWHEQHCRSCGMWLVALYKCYKPLPSIHYKINFKYNITFEKALGNLLRCSSRRYVWRHSMRGEQTR